MSDRFNFGGSVNYINSGGDRVNADAFNVRLIYWAPRVDVTDYEFENGTMKGYRNDGLLGNNPIYGAKTNKFIDDVDRYIGTMNFNYSPWEWFDVTYRIGLDQYTDFRVHQAPAPRGLEEENIFEDNELGFVNETRIRKRDITSTINARLNFDLTDRIDADLMLGNDVFDQSYDRVTTNGDELDIWNLYSLNNAKDISTNSYVEKYRLIGLYGELSMSYDNALYLTLTGRNDWSSALPMENNSFFYPSVNLGYVFSETYDLPSFISYGKFRASYAEIGKDTRPYRTNVVYGSAPDFPIDGVSGWTRDAQKGDRELKPERTTTLEFGADLRFLENRFGLDLTWYKQNSKDQIIPVPASLATGFGTFILNAGEIENKGVELRLNANPLRTQDFNWDVTLQYTNNNNEVIAIKEGIDQIFLGAHFGYAGSTASNILIPGQAYGNIFGTSYARYYSDPGDEPEYFIDESRSLLIGENGFPVIESDPKILGNSTPDWFGSLQSDFSWKQFGLSFLFDTRQGVQKYNQMDNFMAAFGIAPYTLNRDETVVFDGVTVNGEPNTTEVFLGQGVGPDGEDYGAGYYRNYYRAATENFVEDADWIRLRNLSLSYSLPTKWLTDVFISNAKITLSGYNLWLDTDYSGWDPEGNRGNGNGDVGFGGFTYPNTRSYTVKLNVSF